MATVSLDALYWYLKVLSKLDLRERDTLCFRIWSKEEQMRIGKHSSG